MLECLNWPLEADDRDNCGDDNHDDDNDGDDNDDNDNNYDNDNSDEEDNVNSDDDDDNNNDIDDVFIEKKKLSQEKKLRLFINKNFFLPSSRFRLMRCLYKDKLLSVPINAPSKKTRLRDRFRLKNEKDFFLTGRKKRLKSFLTFCFSFQASFLFSFFHLRFGIR